MAAKRITDVFSLSDDLSDYSDELNEYKKRRRSVIDGCNCDLALLPERFLLYKVEKELSKIMSIYSNTKVYELEKSDWLTIKRNIRDLLSAIKTIKDE